MGAWGTGLFQCDEDVNCALDFDLDGDLDELEEAYAKTAPDLKYAGRHYSFLAGVSDDSEHVRKYLDSGVLAKVVARWEAKIAAKNASKTKELASRTPEYTLLILGACAMSHGCRLPESLVSFLKTHYDHVGLGADAVKQMKKALFGLDGYAEGIPYPFGDQVLQDTIPKINNWQKVDHTNPHDPMAKAVRATFADKIAAREADPSLWMTNCGWCSETTTKEGKPLLLCAGCKDQKYCSKRCMKAHWKTHKKRCAERFRPKDATVDPKAGQAPQTPTTGTASTAGKSTAPPKFGPPKAFNPDSFTSDDGKVAFLGLNSWMEEYKAEQKMKVPQDSAAGPSTTKGNGKPPTVGKSPKQYESLGFDAMMNDLDTLVNDPDSKSKPETKKERVDRLKKFIGKEGDKENAAPST